MGWTLLNMLQAAGIVFATFSTGVLGFSLFGFTWNRDLQCSFTRTVWSPMLMFMGGIELHIEHEAPVPWDQPHIYVMNHQSAADIPACFIAIPVNLRFIAKAVIRYIPWLGTYMLMTGMIFVDRGNRRKAMSSMRKSAKRIREGCNIIAYAEGTRSRSGRVLPFKKGPFVLALEAGVPIVPCAIEGGQKVLPPGFKMRPGPVRIKTGTPIPTDTLTKDDRIPLMERVRAEVIRLHLEIGGEGAEEGSPAVDQRL